MRTFVIRKIPDHIWKSVKIRVAQEGITLNEAMLILVKAYAGGEINIKKEENNA